MTRNERIAKKMGWIKYFGNEPMITDSGHKVSFLFIRNPDGKIEFDITFDIATAKLLQARMVEDGWYIKINQSKYVEPQFWCDARSVASANTYDYRAEDDTEPAALVALFVKVYGITEEA
jgi:hypothetical protein